jgi:hypothetical protein
MLFADLLFSFLFLFLVSFCTSLPRCGIGAERRPLVLTTYSLIILFIDAWALHSRLELSERGLPESPSLYAVVTRARLLCGARRPIDTPWELEMHCKVMMAIQLIHCMKLTNLGY